MEITVTGVERGTPDQPLVIHYAGDNGRPYKPCKSMRKVLIFAWGEDGNAWAGRSMTLYNKSDVKFGGIQVGGIRISHMSHIQADIQVSLTETKGKKTPIVIKRMDIKAAPEMDLQGAADRVNAAAQNGIEALEAAWKSLSKAERAALGPVFLAKAKQTAEGGSNEDL
jgi:hypothetical protein